MVSSFRVGPEADNRGRPAMRSRCDGIAFVAACLPAHFRNPIRIAAELQPNLVACRSSISSRPRPRGTRLEPAHTLRSGATGAALPDGRFSHYLWMARITPFPRRFAAPIGVG